MTKKFFIISIAALILFSFTATLTADIIILKSGREIEGDIVEETEELVAVEMDSGTGFFSKEDIESINKTRVGVARGKIVDTEGTVEVLAKGETQWKPAEKGMSLDEGYSIRSGPDSKAIAIFADKAIIAVEQKSEVDLEKLQKSRKTGINIKANLNSGQLWNDVGRLSSKRSRFYIETPQAVTGVRGTAFTVKVDEEARTTVAVVNGTVDVRTRGLMRSPTAIGANKMTEVVMDQPPADPVTASEEFLAQWNQYKGQFRMLRMGMLGGRFGLSPTQTLLAGAAIGVLIVVVLVILLLRRRKA